MRKKTPDFRLHLRLPDNTDEAIDIDADSLGSAIIRARSIAQHADAVYASLTDKKNINILIPPSMGATRLPNGWVSYRVWPESTNVAYNTAKD